MVQRNKQLGSLFLALLLVAALPRLARAQFAPLPAVRLPPHPAVARIVVPEQKGAVSYGSGTLVDVRGDYGLVVTNWHVVRDAAETITVIFPDGFRCAARVLKTDKDWDLAALAVWRPSAQPVPVAAVSPRPGDVLTIAGYGSGHYRASTGRCTAYATPHPNMPLELVEISTEARQGDSGGPIFNTQGELAGVLFGASYGTTVGSYADRVRRFLAPLAPDLGRGEAPDIAVSPPRRNEPPAAVAALPSVKPPAPPVVQSPRVAAKPPAKPATPLTPVAPVENHESGPRATPLPGVDHVAAAEFGAPPGVRPLPEPPSVQESAAPLEASVDLSRAAPGISWQAVAGDTLLSQIKTVLAAVGVLALLLHGVRLFAHSPSPPPSPETTD